MLMATNPTTNAGRHTTHRRPSNNTFSPVLSSPLSPRTSIATAATTGSSSGAMLPSPPRSPILQKPVRRRAYKPIPSPTAESRRSLFLKKVQNAREEKAWQARGGQDEIMRMIFVAEQKRWRASLEMAARMIPTIREEEEDEIREAANGHAQPEELPEELLMEEQEQTDAEHDGGAQDEFEEFLNRDGKELEDLLSSMDLDLDQKMGDW